MYGLRSDCSKIGRKISNQFFKNTQKEIRAIFVGAIRQEKQENIFF